MKTRLLIVAVVSAFVASVATHLVDRGVLRARADERWYKVPGM